MYPTYANTKTIEKIGTKIVEINEQLRALNSDKALNENEVTSFAGLCFAAEKHISLPCIEM